jgi:oligosaccharide repeat unit polymerase
MRLFHVCEKNKQIRRSLMSEANTLGTMVLVMIASLIMTRRLVNPILLFTFGYFATLAGFYVCRELSDTVADFSNYTSYNIYDASRIYTYAVCGFVIPWLIPLVRLAKRKPRVVSEFVIWPSWLFKSVSIALVANVAVCCAVLGHIPVVQMLLGKMTIDAHLNSLSTLPFGLMAIQTTLGMSLALQLASRLYMRVQGTLRHKRQFYFPYLALLVACTWQGNRQLLFFSVVIVLLRFVIGREMRFCRALKLLGIGAVSVAILVRLFIGIQSIRLQGNGASPYEIFGYLTWPVMNMQTIAEHVPLNGKVGMPDMILREVIPYRFRSDEYEKSVMPYLAVPSSPSGFVAYLYLDYRTIGVVIGAIVLGFVARRNYVLASSSEHRTRLLLLVLWCCLTSSIYSHFISLNNYWLPLTFLIVAQKLATISLKVPCFKGSEVPVFRLSMNEGDGGGI